MQFSLLLALVAAITISENSPQEPIEFAWPRILLALSIAAGVVLLAVVGSMTISRGILHKAHKRSALFNSFDRLKRAHMTLWLAAVCIILYALGWPQIVRYNWGLDGTVLIKDLLLLAPVWLPLLLSWAAFYEVEKAAFHSRQMETESDDRQVAFTRRSHFVWLNARHYLGLCILPVLALLLFQDLVTLILPNWQDSELAWLLFLIPLAVLSLLFPQLLSRIWRTETLPDCPLRQRLEKLANNMGVGCRDFKVWKTDGQMLNAAVAGFLPSVRYVFLTDALLCHLNDDEIEAVVAHEMGHVRRHHLILRMLVLCLPVWVIACVQTIETQTSGPFAQWFASVLAHSQFVKCLFLPLTTLVLIALLLGWYSRLLEHDADLCVIGCGRADTFVTSIERLSQLTGGKPHRRSWLHPSITQRIHLMQHAMAHPHVARHYHRRVNRLNILLAVVWLIIPFVGFLLEFGS